MVISWYPLDLGGLTDTPLPPLSISKSFEADSYTIHLTDLTHIWSESIDHATILKRAEEENTSIDPSSNSQLQILLEKLAVALSYGPDTTLSLHIPSSPGCARPTLSLHLTIQLPQGLAPLEWPIRLSAAPQSVLTSHLTVPLLQAQYSRMQEMQGLAEALNEKDLVIQKLLDRLETQGTDLGQVFPQATARGGRKVDRKQAEEKVRGLAPFNIEAWRKGLSSGRVQGTAHLVQKVFTVGSTLPLGAAKTDVDVNWWETVRGTTINLSNDNSATTQASKPLLRQRESTEANDDFQVQASPPRLTSKTPKFSRRIALDDSTDDNDLDAASQVSRPSKVAKGFRKIGRKNAAPKKPKPGSDILTDDEEEVVPKLAKKFGKIGGRRNSSTLTNNASTGNEEPSPPTTGTKVGSKEETKEFSAERSTNGESSTDDSEPKPEKKSKTGDCKEETSLPVIDDSIDNSIDNSNPIPPKSGKKLGKIGGKQWSLPAKAPAPSLPAENETTGEEAPSQQRRFSNLSFPEPIVKTKWGLGKIGRKNKAPSTSPSPDPPEKTRQPKKGRLGRIGDKKESTPTPPVSQQEATPAKRKLGVIGLETKKAHEGKSIVMAGDVEDEDEEEDKEEDRGRGRSVEAKKEKAPTPRETSEERAEKKRKQLKKELEEKAKAPAKKRRKF